MKNDLHTLINSIKILQFSLVFFRADVFKRASDAFKALKLKFRKEKKRFCDSFSRICDLKMSADREILAEIHLTHPAVTDQKVVCICTRIFLK